MVTEYEDTTVLFPLAKNPWNQSLLKRNVQRRKIHYWAQQGRIWSLKSHVCPHSLLPTLLRFCDLRLWGWALHRKRASYRLTHSLNILTGRMQPRFLITCVFFLFFVALLLQVLRFASVACPGCLRCRQCSSMLKLVCGFVHGRS